MHQVGDILAEKYRLERSIGKGGMGEVFEVVHMGLGKRFAIKIPTPELMDDEHNLERFKQEPKVAAATGHRCIVDIYDIGLTAKGIPFVVMELLEGESFGDLIKRQGKIDLPMATYIIAQVLSALSAAHSKGIIHRDLKPDNVYLVPTGHFFPDVKLLDFGTSKIMTESGAAAQSLTQTGTIVGTPYYMAPEQIRAVKQPDHRLDVYAAGVMLYEAVTGMVPFYSDNVYTLVHIVLNDELIPPRTYRSDLPPPLEAIILKAMERNREIRYESAEAMLQDMLPYMDDVARLRVWVPEGLRASVTGSEDPTHRGSNLRATALQAVSEVDGESDSPLILDRYSALKKIVRARTGTIYLGRAETAGGFKKPVGINLIHPHLVEHKSVVRSLIRESKLAQRVVHPNIVRLIDFGEHAGQYVTVMEYVHGYNLQTFSRYLAATQRPLGVEQAAYIAFRVLQGLSYAHKIADELGESLGLYHCDITPRNILISVDGQIRLTSFGTNRALFGNTGSESSRSGADFAHMAPEQVNGEPIDHRTDLFSVGIILFEMLSGQPLFGASGDAITIMRVSKADVPNIRHIRPDLPLAASMILGRALSLSPAGRYQDADSFAADLSQLIGGANIEDVESTFRALITQTVVEEGFRATVGQLFDLSKALETVPIPFGSLDPEETAKSPLASSPQLVPSELAPSGRGSPFKIVLVIAVTVVLLAGGALAAVLSLSNNQNNPVQQQSVNLIINQTDEDSSSGEPDENISDDPQVGDDSNVVIDDGGTKAQEADIPDDPPDVGSPAKSKVKGHRPPRALKKLDGKTVSRTLMKRRGALTSCMRQHKKSSGGAQITAIKVVINQNGSVSSASVEPGKVNSTPLGRCVNSITRSTRFPRHPDPTVGFRIPLRR